MLIQDLHQSMEEHMQGAQRDPVVLKKIQSYNTPDLSIAWLTYIGEKMGEMARQAMQGQKLYRMTLELDAHQILADIEAQELDGFPKEKYAELKANVPQFFKENSEVFFTQDGGYIGKFTYEEGFIKQFWGPLVQAAMQKPESEAAGVISHIAGEFTKEKHQFHMSDESLIKTPIAKSLKIYDENGAEILSDIKQFDDFMADPKSAIEKAALKNKISGMSQTPSADNNLKPH